MVRNPKCASPRRALDQFYYQIQKQCNVQLFTLNCNYFKFQLVFVFYVIPTLTLALHVGRGECEKEVISLALAAIRFASANVQSIMVQTTHAILLYSYRGLSTEGTRASVAPRAARTAAAAAASRGHASTANYQHRGLPQPLGETAPTAARTSADREVEEFEE